MGLKVPVLQLYGWFLWKPALILDTFPKSPHSHNKMALGSYHLGNSKDFSSFLPEMGTKTKYLIINHIITLCHTSLLQNYSSITSTKIRNRSFTFDENKEPSVTCTLHRKQVEEW